MKKDEVITAAMETSEFEEILGRFQPDAGFLRRAWWSLVGAWHMSRICRRLRQRQKQ